MRNQKIDTFDIMANATKSDYITYQWDTANREHNQSSSSYETHNQEN